MRRVFLRLVAGIRGERLIRHDSARMRWCDITDPGGLVQLFGASGSYPQGPGFKSLHRHQCIIPTRCGCSIRLPDDAAVSAAARSTPRPVPAHCLVARTRCALLHVLLKLRRLGGIELTSLAHFDSGLRGADAAAEEECCRSLAASVNVKFDAGRGDVAEQRAWKSVLLKMPPAVPCTSSSGSRAAAERERECSGHSLDNRETS